MRPENTGFAPHTVSENCFNLYHAIVNIVNFDIAVKTAGLENMSVETGMYLYPWEIKDVETFKKDYASTGCTGMAPALCYHHGNALIARSGRFKTISESALSFTPNTALYGDIKAEVHAEAARAGVVKALRGLCADTGRAFSGWLVLLHNSTQGARHPDICIENLFGDRYVHALCPSHPEVRRYAEALVTDICAQFSPDSLLLEAITPQPARHGAHHEIANIAVPEALRWLWSLCFCPRCMEEAARLVPGLDPQALRERAKKLVLGLANGETLIPANEGSQTMMLMLEAPELFAYQRARQFIVAGFIAEISRLLRKARVEFRLIPSALPFDINHVYMEGMNFTATAGLADRLMPLIYRQGETYEIVRNTIRLFDGDTPIGMVNTLFPTTSPDKASFLGAMKNAHDGGCDTFYIYNYSMASTGRLGWIAEMNKVFYAQH
ncbi:MAG: hypothetical protein LBP37_07435 [Spirochaetaceae bacterium]|jgi:hypothetical protein|nr:hypothetical protein [Spirochaetaceae bacterium]